MCKKLSPTKTKRGNCLVLPHTGYALGLRPVCSTGPSTYIGSRVARHARVFLRASCKIYPRTPTDHSPVPSRLVRRRTGCYRTVPTALIGKRHRNGTNRPTVRSSGSARRRAPALHKPIRAVLRSGRRGVATTTTVRARK